MFSVLLGAAAPGAAGEPEATTRLRGAVRHQTGRIVVDAVVILERVEDAPATARQWRAITTRLGDYRIDVPRSLPTPTR